MNNRQKTAYGGTFFFCDNEYKGREYKVWKVKEIETDSYDNIECGKIIEVFGLNHFMIKVYDGLIEVVECDNIDLQAGDYL